MELSAATAAQTGVWRTSMDASERRRKRLTCELRSHGEYGWEAQFFENEEFIYGRRFDLKAQARQWAGLEKQDRERDGWQLALASSPTQ